MWDYFASCMNWSLLGLLCGLLLGYAIGRLHASRKDGHCDHP